MTRLLTTGFETGDVNEAGVSTISGATLTVVSSVPAPRVSGFCLKVASTTTQWTAGTYKTFTLAASKTELWVRFAFFCSGSNSVVVPIAQLLDSGGTAQVTLGYSAADGFLRVGLGPGFSPTLGTASVGFAPNAWHVIEWREQILTATTGATEVWVDGNQVISFSGDVASTSTLNVQGLRLGVTTTAAGTHSANPYVAYDDIAINDTAGTRNNGRPGDARVVLLTPTGAGSSTQWARGGTDTGANWSQTSEVPPSMTQYVSSPTVAQRDLYAMSDIPGGGAPIIGINVVESLVLAQNNDAGAGSLGLTIKSGATTNELTAVALGTVAATLTGRWEVDPNGSIPWTVANVNALEAGVTVR